MARSLEERVAERIAKGFQPSSITEIYERLYKGELLTREQAEGRLGEGTFDAYAYAHKAEVGLWRLCGNAAISHMVECGERAKNLGFEFVYVAVALLHDSVEDRSKAI